MKIFKAIISSIFSVFLWAFVIVLCSLNICQSIISKDTINYLFDNVNVSEFIKNSDGSYTDFGEDITEEMEKAGIPSSLVNEFIDSEPITDYIQDYYNNTIDYLLYGDEYDGLDANEINDFLNKNIDKIVLEIRENKKYGYEELTDERVDLIKSNINDITDKFVSEATDLKNIIDDNEGINFVRYFFSDIIVTLFVVIVLIFTIVIVLLNLKHFSFGYWIGTTYILGALPFFVLEILILNNRYTKNYDEIVSKISKIIIKYPTIFLILGILFIAIPIVASIVKKSKKSVENASDVDLTNEVKEEQKITDEQEIDDIFCKYCGTKLNKEQKFCSNCGDKQK